MKFSVLIPDSTLCHLESGITREYSKNQLPPPLPPWEIHTISNEVALAASVTRPNHTWGVGSCFYPTMIFTKKMIYNDGIPGDFPQTTSWRSTQSLIPLSPGKKACSRGIKWLASSVCYRNLVRKDSTSVKCLCLS